MATNFLPGLPLLEVMNHPRRRWVVGTFIAALLIASSTSALACSCAGGTDDRDTFNHADAAVIGEVIEVIDEGNDRVHRIAVEDDFKVDLGETVEVHTQVGSSCGLSADVGDRIGLFLYRDRNSQWTSNLCARRAPREIRKAASPLPRPTGHGPTRLLVGGSFGKARVIALDRRGRTLDYGYGGDSDSFQLEVCPGNRRFVEISQAYPADPEFAIRRVASLRVRFATNAPIRRQRIVGGLVCRDHRARSVMVLASRLDRPRAVLYEFTPSGFRRRYDGLPAEHATFDRTYAYLSGDQKKLWRLNLDTGTRTTLRRGRHNFGPPELSPNGKWVASVMHGVYREKRGAKIVLIRTSDLEVRTMRFGWDSHPQIEWAGNRRLVVLSARSRGSRLLNLKRESMQRLGRWRRRDAAVVAGKVWGAEYGTLWKMKLTGGKAKRDRTLPSPVNYAITSVR